MSQASFNDDATGVVKAIQDGVETAVIVIDDKEYTTRPVFIAPEKADTDALEIATLGGLVEYLNENVDEHNFAGLVIVINNPASVSVFAQIESRKDPRVEWLETKFELCGFPFERYLDHEQFMVKSQALFVDEFDREKMLKFIGNLSTALVQSASDDGVSQQVTIETGVRKSDVLLPNPVQLAPYRTFPEINQPSSPFVLRVKQMREGQMPEVGLFEADGGLWRQQAIAGIKQFIKAKLSDDAAMKIPIIG